MQKYVALTFLVVLICLTILSRASNSPSPKPDSLNCPPTQSTRATPPYSDGYYGEAAAMQVKSFVSYSGICEKHFQITSDINLCKTGVHDAAADPKRALRCVDRIYKRINPSK